MSPLKHFALWSVGLKRAETQTSQAERDCLARHVANCRRVVEIGTWHGVTTARLCKSMPSDGVLYAVDPYYPGRLGISLQRLIARREVARAGRVRVKWVRKTGEHAAQELKRVGDVPVDFVFIDGDHSYEGLSKDWNGWKDLVAPNGLVALHDSRPPSGDAPRHAGSVKYTEEVILRDPSFELVDAVDSLTVLRRRAPN